MNGRGLEGVRDVCGFVVDRTCRSIAGGFVACTGVGVRRGRGWPQLWSEVSSQKVSLLPREVLRGVLGSVWWRGGCGLPGACARQGGVGLATSGGRRNTIDRCVVRATLRGRFAVGRRRYCLSFPPGCRLGSSSSSLLLDVGCGVCILVACVRSRPCRVIRCCAQLRRALCQSQR